MLKAISFAIVKITGEEEKFPAAELNFQKPTVKGWQSPKFCSYPQVLVIRLEARTRICKFQLLSHQYLVSKKVEIHAGDVPNDVSEVPQNVIWEKQGEFSLSKNIDSNYTAREMRSSYLDVVAKFVKIILSQNHINRLNLCNQVGIIGMNVIGELILEGGPKKAKYMADQNAQNIGSENISPLDDLSFSMYVDPEVGQILKILHNKKCKAVEKDRFVYAKRLKYAMYLLQKLGEKLGKLDIEKQIAIDAEDYDKAYVKKEQMESLRMQEYRRLHLTELMEYNGNPDQEDKDLNLKERISAEPTSLSEVRSPMISNYVNTEESFLPTFKKGKSQPSVFAGEKASSENSAFGEMTERDKRLASLPIDVFGLSLVQKIYSKSHSLREDALQDILEYLQKDQNKGKSHPPGDVIRACAFLFHKALKDKVFSVYSKVLEDLKHCFGVFIPHQNVPKADFLYLTDKTFPDIIIRLGDTAPRMKNATIDYIMKIVSYPEIVNLQAIPHHCLEPIHHDRNTRLAHAKCELAQNLVKKHPPWKERCLPLNKVMLFLVDALNHPSSKVKNVAEKTIFFIYEHEGKAVRKYLPASSKVARKNILFRRVFHTLDKIDKQKRAINKSETKHSKTPHEKSSTWTKEGVPIPVSSINIEKTCVFCEEYNEDFTSELLDIHYDKYCQMLMHCSNCNQVVEISGITEHLLEECDFKEQYKQCSICLEAIARLNYEDHIRIRTCTMAKGIEEANHCPLCHNNIRPGEEGWKEHLMDDKGCLYNKRRKTVQKRKSMLLKNKAIT